MIGSDIAKQVEERTGYPTQAWETGNHWTIVVRIDDEREAWAEPSGYWSVHLRRAKNSIPYASQPTEVPETVDDPERISAGIEAALKQLLTEANDVQGE